MTLPWPRIGMATNFVNAFISAASVERRGGVHVLAARHRQAHAEEEHAELRLLHPVDEVLQLLQRQAGLGDGVRVDALALDERAQDR